MANSPKLIIPHVPVVFAYEHQYRRVDVEGVWQSKEGHWLITGRDLDRDGEYRSFRVDRIQGKIKILKKVNYGGTERHQMPSCS